MRSGRIVTLIVACCLVFVAAPTALGQAEGDSSPKKPPLPEKHVSKKPAPSKAEPSANGSMGEAVSEVRPEIYYLKNKDGVLQAVPGFQFEDFMRLYNLKVELERSGRPARYSLERLELSGAARDDRAELEAQVTIATQDSQWVRVPLGLAPAMMTEKADYSGPGEQIVDFDAREGGYVVWLRGAAGQRHTLKLKLLTGVIKTNDQWKLALSVPRSVTAPRLRL
ncbi:MAG: hypothetical protein WD176_04235, partial [Pirellulales bacterium]